MMRRRSRRFTVRTSTTAVSYRSWERGGGGTVERLKETPGSRHRSGSFGLA